MASTSPTGARKPLRPWFHTSGTPPYRRCNGRHLARHAFQRARQQMIPSHWRQHQVSVESFRTRVTLPEMPLVAQTFLIHQPFACEPSGPSSHAAQAAMALSVDAIKI